MAATATAATAIYAILGFFVVPRVVRFQIEKLSREMLHREAKVARVRFNPFTLTGAVEGFELKDRDGADLFKLHRLVVNVQVSGLLRRTLKFREITIDRPEAVARILADGRPNIADLFEAETAPETTGEDSQLPRLVVERLAVGGGRLEFVDETRSPRFQETLSPLDFEVHALSTIPEESGEHVLAFAIGDRTRVRWSGRQVVQPLHLSGKLEVKDVSLVRAWQYAAREHALELRDGRADLAFSYDVRQSAAGAITASLEDGSLALHDVAVRPRGGDEDWLTVPAAEARSIRASWPESRLGIGEIRVTEPRAVAWIDSSRRTNWEAALTGAEDAAELTSPSGLPKPWTMSVGAVDIAGGSARLEDRSVEPGVPVRLTELGLRLENLSTDLAAPVTASVAARVNDTAEVTATGSVVPDPLAAELTVMLRGLDLVPFRTYAAVPNVELRSGVAGIEGKLRVTPGAPWIRFDGEGEVNALEVVDAGANRLLAWDRCRARGVRMTLTPNRLRIGEVAVDRAFMKIAIDREGTLNVSKLAAGEPPPQTPSPAGGGTPPAPNAAFPLDVTKIAIRDTRIDFTDESLILPFGTDIHSASGTIQDLSTTSAAAARLVLEGRVADTGYVKADGTLRIADPFASTDVGVTFRDVNMSTLTPYLAHFAGYAVEKGNLDLDIRYRIDDRRLVGDHRVVAKDLELGEKVEGASGVGLPVRLAIALLKDKDGRIDLQVPIEGTVDSPEFAYRTVFWQAFKKILANVAMAPFRAIGRLFGRDEEDLDLVGFVAGRSDLLAPEQETLSKLAAELAGRSGISVDVEGRFDPVTDAEALRRARLELRIDAKRQSVESLEEILEALYSETFSPENLEAERSRFMPAAAPAEPAEPRPAEKKKRKKKAAETPPPHPKDAFDAAGFYDALRAQLLAAENVGEAELEDLSRARAGAIVAALTAPGGLDASRVKALDPAPVKRKKQGSDLVASEMSMSARD